MAEGKNYKRLTLILQAILVVGLAGAIWEQQWLNAVIICGVIVLSLYPLYLAKHFRVLIPAEFQLLTIGFVFAAVFLGEVHGYYTRFWWWDIVLHTSSGFLLGIIGFLLVYVMNESERINLNMRPGFVALFAFLFALGAGTLWEIFEFAMDSIFGTTMQKPMLGDDSGLTDTMWDLIVDAIGALIISVLGYGYIKTTNESSFLERMIHRFIRSNPRLFRRDNSQD